MNARLDPLGVSGHGAPMINAVKAGVSLKAEPRPCKKGCTWKFREDSCSAPESGLPDQDGWDRPLTRRQASPYSSQRREFGSPRVGLSLLVSVGG